MSKNNNNNYGEDLILGLAPAVELSELGRVYIDTTQSLAGKLVDKFNQLGLREIDNIIITPKLSDNEAGIDSLYMRACFSIKTGGGIFYKGKGNKARYDNGRINILELNGGNAGNMSGPFGMSDSFRSSIKPFCHIDNNGNPIMKLERAMKDTATMELDTNRVLALALGIKMDGQYNFSVLKCEPIPQSNKNFNLILYKYIDSSGVKGRNSHVNYSSMEDELFYKYNGGGRNGGGRNNRRSY